MHVFFGFTLSEWAGIITIITAGLSAFIKYAIKPLLEKFDELSHTIRDLDHTSRKERELIRQHLAEHDTAIAKHDTEISFLYSEKGWHREK